MSSAERPDRRRLRLASHAECQDKSGPFAWLGGLNASWPRTASCLGVFLLAAAMLSPLAWTSVPALVDYPNHLARMWILVHCARIPALARNYVVHWRVLPDMAMDFVVPALARMMPV